uniref:PAP-associated domain-containing protein n=1 Tax=Heligmosomoides polygyrus TaxID=6339 RepID=A0A183G7Q2_HELPZ
LRDFHGNGDFKIGQNIDIQFPDDQFQAIRNTNLIRHYVQCDSRLSRLFLYLRMLFDALEIRNSKYGLLSSYHILLLTIHFLQSEQALFPWPVLPVLCKTHSNLVGAHIPIDDVVSTLDSAQGPVGAFLFVKDYRGSGTVDKRRLFFAIWTHFVVGFRHAHTF